MYIGVGCQAERAQMHQTSGFLETLAYPFVQRKQIHYTSPTTLRTKEPLERVYRLLQHSSSRC